MTISEGTRADAQVKTAFRADRTQAAPHHCFAHQPKRNLVHGSETAAVPFHPDALSGVFRTRTYLTAENAF